VDADRVPRAQVNSKFYFVAQQQSLATSFEAAYYLVEAPTTGYLLRPVAVLTSGGLAPLDVLPSYRQRAEISAVSSNSFMWAGREAYTFEDGILGTPGTTAWSWSMHADDGQIPVSFGGSAYLSGGLVSQIDGTHVAECGFAYSPQITNVSVTAGSATWIYAFSYIWLDNEGKLHESALGPTAYSMGQIQVGVTKTSAATPVTCSVQTLSLTNRQRGGAGSTLSETRSLSASTARPTVTRSYSSSETIRWIRPGPRSRSRTAPATPRWPADQRHTPRVRYRSGSALPRVISRYSTTG
jgi:hypothetical protein